ncbi:MAG: condensation domain-containing protein [Clostridia bacterium]|nr:condensation domain-containing protein [Clostridia bacterium]
MEPKYYDLCPSQDNMYTMLKYCIHKQVVQIPTSFAIDQKLDYGILQKALNIEIERNDCMRICFFKDKETKKVRQYFADKKEYTAQILKFTTADEQDAFLARDAQKPVKIFKGETFRVFFFDTCKGGSGIYLNASHLIMDASSVMTFYADLMKVYRALASGSDMPEPLYPYEERVEKDIAYLSNESGMTKDDKFFREYFDPEKPPFYAGVHGHDLLDKARKKKKDPNLRVPAAYNPIKDKAEMITRHVCPEDAAKIFDYCQKHLCSPENLILMGFRTYASSVNYRTDDVFITVLCSRRSSYKDKSSGGCMAQTMQVRTVIGEDKTFTQALAEINRVRTQLYRHINYPYTKALAMTREVYNFKLVEAPGCMMFTWLPLPISAKDTEYDIDFRGYNLGRYIFPLYVFSFPNMKDGGIDFMYMYKPSLIKPEHIHALHDKGLEVMLKGVENPDLTVGELLDIAEK